jgi:MFS family permease
MRLFQSIARAFRDYFAMIRMFQWNARMVLCYSIAEGVMFGVFRLLFNFYVLSLGEYDESFLGLLTAASALASMIVAVPASFVANRLPAKWILVTSGLVDAGCFIGLVSLPTPFFLVFFNIIFGIATTVRHVSVAPFLMGNSSPEERQYVFSFNFGMVTVAEFVGYFIGGRLPTWMGEVANTTATSSFAYSLALGSMTGVGLLAVLPLFLIRKQPAVAAASSEKWSWAQVKQDVGVLSRLLSSPFVIGLGAGLMVPFFNLYFRDVFKQSDEAIGVIFMLGAIAMGIAQFLSAPLASRFGKIGTVILGQAISVIFLILMGLAAWLVPQGHVNVTLWLAIASLAYLVRMALMNMAGPVYQTFILENVRREMQAFTTGLNSIAFQIGWFVSPAIAGLLLARYKVFGFAPIYGITALLYIAGTALIWVFFRNTEKNAHPSGDVALQIAGR